MAGIDLNASSLANDDPAAPSVTPMMQPDQVKAKTKKRKDSNDEDTISSTSAPDFSFKESHMESEGSDSHRSNLDGSDSNGRESSSDE